MTSSSSSMFSVERRNFTDLVIVQTLLPITAPYVSLYHWCWSSPACLTLILSHQLLISSLFGYPPVPRVCLQMTNNWVVFYLCYQRANLLQSVYLTTVQTLCLQPHNHRQDLLSCFHSRELLSYLGETNLQTVDSAPRARPNLLPWRWQMQG